MNEWMHIYHVPSSPEWRRRRNSPASYRAAPWWPVLSHHAPWGDAALVVRAESRPAAGKHVRRLPNANPNSTASVRRETATSLWETACMQWASTTATGSPSATLLSNEPELFTWAETTNLWGWREKTTTTEWRQLVQVNVVQGTKSSSYIIFNKGKV